MITFTDIPEGMEFVSVEVVENEYKMIETTYLYQKDAKEIYVCHRSYNSDNQETQLVEDPKEYKKYKGYRVSIENNNGITTATATKDNGIIDIMGEIGENTVFDILDKIKSF